MRSFYYILFGFLIFSILSCNQEYSTKEKIPFPLMWKFKIGNDNEYKQERYDDSNWDSVSSNLHWEDQGYPRTDGYAWYRNKVFIPLEFRNKIRSEHVQIYLGPIADYDKLFLNGELIGQNNSTTDLSNELIPYIGIPIPGIIRRYILPVDDKRIKWGEYNTFAIQVYNQEENGGLHTVIQPYFGEIGIGDSIEFSKSTFYSFSVEGIIDTTLVIENHSSSPIGGTLHLTLNESSTDNKEIFKTKIDLKVNPYDNVAIPISLPVFLDPVLITYRIDDKLSRQSFNDKSLKNFILPRYNMLEKFDSVKRP